MAADAFRIAAHNNPYTATVVPFTEEHGSGFVRVEPPANIGDDLLDELRGDVRVELRHQVTTAEATLLRFTVDSQEFPRYPEDAEGNRARVGYTVSNLIETIGFAASSSLLKDKKW